MIEIVELIERGRSYLAAGDPSTAARLLAEAAESAPGDRALLTDLALAHFQSAALGRAERVARTLVELDPSDSYAHLLLGRVLARQSRHTDALPHLRLAAAMSDDAQANDALDACLARVA